MARNGLGKFAEGSNLWGYIIAYPISEAKLQDVGLKKEQNVLLPNNLCNPFLPPNSSFFLTKD